MILYINLAKIPTHQSVFYIRNTSFKEFLYICFVKICKTFSFEPKVLEKNADNINTKNRAKDMAETFNLNNFLQTYKTQTYDPTKQHAAAEERMEAKLQQQAQEAVQQSGLLTLTLSEKMAELGIGERALKQFADTAVGLVTDIVNPIGDYLEKYENIFDQRVYNQEIQSYAKQMFFASQAMRQEAAENTTGQNFVYDM